MTIQHRDLPDSELHEPKGVFDANDGEVYVADGGGSGAWMTPPLAAYGGMAITQNATTTSVTAAGDGTLHTAGDFVKVTAGWAASPQSKNIVFQTDKLIVKVAGVYKIDAYLVVISDTNNIQVGLRYAVNGNVGEISRTPQSRVATTSNRYLITGVGLTDSFNVDDEVDLYIAATQTANITVEDAATTLQLMESP